MMARSQWISQTLPEENCAILGVDFISPDRVIIGGWGGNPPQQIYAEAFYTLDGGNNWIQSEIPDSMTIINNVQIINENLCYGVGAYNFSLREPYYKIKRNVKDLIHLVKMNYSRDFAMQDRSRGLFVESTDGGLTWHSKGILKDSVYHLFNLSFISEQKGFIVASSINDSGYAILKTIDGGNNWYYTYPFEKYLSIEDIQFIDESNGIAAGEIINGNETGVVLKTSDGGESWRKYYINELSKISGVVYLDSINIFIVGMDSNFKGYVYKSTDAGNTWKEFHSYDQFSLLDGIDVFAELNYLMVLGVAAQNIIPFVDISFDAGNIWLYSPLTQFQNYLPINSKMIDSQRWYLTGSTFGLDGFVLFTNNSGGLSEVLNSSDIELLTFSLGQNYPNPFNPVTTINYSLPSVGTSSAYSPRLRLDGAGRTGRFMKFVQLKVYNSLGEEVATLVNEQQPPGSYEVKLDGSNLPSGVYVYRLNAGNFTAERKMVLVK